MSTDAMVRTPKMFLSAGCIHHMLCCSQPKIRRGDREILEDCNESNCSSLANDESEAQKLLQRTRALIYKQLGQPAA